MSATGKGKGKVFVSNPHEVAGGRGKRHVTMPKMISTKKDHISKPAFRRLARRAGVKVMSSSIYDDARIAIRAFVEETVRDAVTLTEGRGQKTVTLDAVRYALKCKNRGLLTKT